MDIFDDWRPFFLHPGLLRVAVSRHLNITVEPPECLVAGTVVPLCFQCCITWSCGGVTQLHTDVAGPWCLGFWLEMKTTGFYNAVAAQMFGALVLFSMVHALDLVTATGDAKTSGKTVCVKPA